MIIVRASVRPFSVTPCPAVQGCRCGGVCPVDVGLKAKVTPPDRSVSSSQGPCRKLTALAPTAQSACLWAVGGGSNTQSLNDSEQTVQNLQPSYWEDPVPTTTTT